MAGRLHYLAQPFWGADLRPGEPLPFMCAVDAEEGGAILAQSARGAIAYQQYIDPEGPIYGDPEILARWGDVPSGALTIDADWWNEGRAA